MTEPAPEIPEVEQDTEFDADMKKNRREAIRKRRIKQVWKQGFPIGTPFKEAVLAAIETAKQVYDGRVIRQEQVMTPEHEAAGEFLIVLYIVEKRKKDEKEN